MDTTKLIAFAQAVGVDIKELKQLLNGKVDNATVTQLIEQAKTAVKNDILGEGVSEDLNTLKEIADKIASMSGSTESAVVQKISDLGTRIDNIANLDLVTVYNQAKA
nr:MAG TPA: DNA binding protein [Caudoviricetes sp.]